MSTKRVSQELVNVEVQLPQQMLVSQIISNVEVKLPQQMYVSQVIANVEVVLGTLTRKTGPTTQCT